MKPWLLLPVLILWVPGCAEPLVCDLDGTQLSWSEDEPWPRMPPAGQYGQWTLQRASEPHGLPIDHSKTPGWTLGDGLPLVEFWWRSRLAEGPAPAPSDLHLLSHAPPGWIVLHKEGYSEPGGTIRHQLDAEMAAPANVTANQTAEIFLEFLGQVLDQGAPQAAPIVQTWDTSAGYFFVVEDVTGPFRLESLYVDLVVPTLLGGDMGDTFEPSQMSFPDPPIFVSTGDRVFVFAEEQAEASRDGDGTRLHIGSQGEASLYAEGRRWGETRMRREASAAFSALGLGKPSFHGASYDVVYVDCPD